MNPIDWITASNIGDHADDIATCGGITGINPELVAKTPNPFRVLDGDMVRGQPVIAMKGGAERIHPGMQFKAASMSFGDGKGERVITRRHPRQCH